MPTPPAPLNFSHAQLIQNIYKIISIQAARFLAAALWQREKSLDLYSARGRCGGGVAPFNTAQLWVG